MSIKNLTCKSRIFPRIEEKTTKNEVKKNPNSDTTSSAVNKATNKSHSLSLTFASLMIALVIILLALKPERYAAACMEGIAVWLNFVLPSLFPFFILTALLTKLGRISKLSEKFSPITERVFGLPGISSYCFLISILSGYPVGSRMILDLKKSNLIDSKQATEMSFLCSTSGPMFILGSVGTRMFSSKKIGLVLLLSHLTAVLIICFIRALLRKKTPQSQKQLPALLKIDNALYESVYGAVLSILTVGGFIALFYVFAEILTDLKILALPALLFGKLFTLFNMNDAAQAFTTGLIEVTRGCAMLAPFGVSTLPLAAFLITFGGACILAQQLGYLKSAGVKASAFLLIKVIQAICAALLCIPVSALLL